MDEQFPPIEPYDSGMLDVGDGHQVYWECCGNPQGKAALYLHGGPGSGCTPGQRRFFDPSIYRAVLFDQRGSGRSRPLASEPDADLSTNKTAHLIADIELLRAMLEVDKWTILGTSWGTTLGLAYAEAHPERVNALILGYVTSTSRGEVEWITQSMGRIFPQEWERFVAAVPERLQHLRPVDAYAQLLFDPDPAVREQAAREWCTWEDVHVSFTPGHQPSPRYEDPEFRLRFARLVTHYWSNDAFLGEDQLIRDAGILNGIPGVLICGRYDVSSPLVTAWSISKNWTTSKLHILDDAGHGGGETFYSVVNDALARFAHR
ncbi:MAG TPA: prolyl aminopeptidase [Nitrolancea sp.]|nr:prolyl aminopeptidase [Nitrolancea sp.]